MFGKTLAVIGCGRIGREVGLRMKSFGMHVIGYDALAVMKEPTVACGIEWVESLDAVWPRADYVTVHVPLIEGSTRNLVNDVTLAACKPGVRIINVARGGIVDEGALLRALESGHVAGAAIDVYSQEPPTKDPELKKLVEHPRVLVTPHLGASTAEAQVRVAVEIANQFVALKHASEQKEAPRPEQVSKLLSGSVNGSTVLAALFP